MFIRCANQVPSGVLDPLSSDKVNIGIVVGYFDWFSGYQEVVLAEALARQGHSVTVVTSNRCNPVFADETLRGLGHERSYSCMSETSRGVKILRFKASFHFRASVYCRGLMEALEGASFDRVLFFYPGQFLPAIAALSGDIDCDTCVVYADNTFQNAGISSKMRIVKRLAFRCTKGILYNAVNRKVKKIYGNTNNCLKFVRDIKGEVHLGSLLPLAFDEETFFCDRDLRNRRRLSLGINDSDILIVSAGKIVPVKKIEFLIEVADILMQRGLSVRLVLAGASESNYCHDLRERIVSTTAFPERFDLIGFQSQKEINVLYNAADIGVWPFQPAVSIQQAMGTGLMVALPLNDCVDHLLDRAVGEYFEGGSVQALVETLDRMIKRSDLLDFDFRQRRAILNSGSFSSGSIVEKYLLSSSDGESMIS